LKTWQKRLGINPVAYENIASQSRKNIDSNPQKRLYFQRTFEMGTAHQKSALSRMGQLRAYVVGMDEIHVPVIPL
jgi:hypothetical protein